MAVRTDVTIDFSVSPRLIKIALPSTTITIQDLHDTLRTIEAEVFNMSFLKLINSAGKEPVGGGVLVGITATLQDALIEFAARPGPTTIQCTVSGGNLVAVDDLGATIDPISPTAFTQVVIAQSASATINLSDAAANATAVIGSVVESQGSLTLKQVLNLIMAILGGVTTNGGATFKTPDGAVTRVTSVVNPSNERTSITLTPD